MFLLSVLVVLIWAMARMVFRGKRREKSRRNFRYMAHYMEVMLFTVMGKTLVFTDTFLIVEEMAMGKNLLGFCSDEF